jgi:GTPase SAR1 family protein
MAGPSWNYVLKFIITGERCPSPQPLLSSHTGLTGDAGVGKSTLLVRLTDQRFLANPPPVPPRMCNAHARLQAGTPPEPGPSALSHARTTAAPLAAYSSMM